MRVNKEDLKGIIETYSELGAVIVKKLLPEAELDAVLKEYLSIINKYLGTNYTDAQDSNLVEYFKNNPQKVSEIYDLTQRTASLQQLGLNARISGIIKALIGEDSGCFNKMPFRTDVPFVIKELAHWHQDYFYVKGNTEVVTAWIPFQNTNWINGSIAIMPRSHKLGILTHDTKAGEKKHIPTDIYDNEVRYANVEKGDVIFFNALLLHSSNMNFSDKIRYSVQFRYTNLHLEQDEYMQSVTRLNP